MKRAPQGHALPLRLHHTRGSAYTVQSAAKAHAVGFAPGCEVWRAQAYFGLAAGADMIDYCICYCYYCIKISISMYIA